MTGLKKGSDLNDSLTDDLLSKLTFVKNPQQKCDIAVKLSFVKGNPKIIKPIIALLPLWGETNYSGSKITVYSRLIANYYLSNKKVL